jgi:putative Mn2+ efflux pump MntP
VHVPDSLNQLLTAVALAMDCTAISVAYGLARRGRPESGEFKLAFAFGFFQSLLFILGWAFGSGFRSHLAAWDHWIAFVLLGGIGGKMLWESIGGDETSRSWNMTWARIALLALAASIDAMAVGLGFSMVNQAVVAPAIWIGMASLVLPLAGFHFATRFGKGLGAWAERFGGAVLIGIGAKILFDHLSNGI